MAAALYSGPGVSHPEHKEALQLQASAASAKLAQMETALAEAKAELARQQGAIKDAVGKARMAEPNPTPTPLPLTFNPYP